MFLMMILVLACSAEQEIKANPTELGQFVDFVKRNNLHSANFFNGLNYCVSFVTLMYETIGYAQGALTPPIGVEGAIAIGIIVYDGSLGSESQAMAAVNQFSLQLSRKNHNSH
ncbi:uncharacterized protein LOC124939581 [Impatiens glandulifera]|uniref:uncharacterized protein LOC124939581 n=1 Tax=Impatiens glandulifera TaxID=253017 RepID=UPI001FB0FDB8|nr:uncharacterized protein LOC124939581 [Impatiens glandulifera]